MFIRLPVIRFCGTVWTTRSFGLEQRVRLRFFFAIFDLKRYADVYALNVCDGAKALDGNVSGDPTACESIEK